MTNKLGIQDKDIIRVAGYIKMTVTPEEIAEVYNRLEEEAEADPSGDWVLWVENLLYNIKNESK